MGVGDGYQFRHCLADMEEKFGKTELGARAVLVVAEEVGEFVGAYRRWSGQARRTGTFRDVELELADVVISAYTAAASLGIDLDQAIVDKVGTIQDRGDGADEARGTFRMESSHDG